MNDNQLDKIMESWKEQRSPKDTQFATEEKFTADFFAKAAELPVEKTAKKTFWPIVCKLAACVAVVLCISFVLLKLNRTKEKEETLRGMSIAKVSQNESVKEIKPQVEEADEAVAESVAPQPVMAMGKSKAKLADSNGGLSLNASKPASLPVTAPVANAPIVFNDDAIALDGNGELRVLGTKQIGNMNITGLDGNIVMNDGYLVEYGHNKAKIEGVSNDSLTDDDIVDIANDNYNKANKYVADKVLESQALDFSVTNTGGNVDVTSFETSLSVGGDLLAEKANVAANVMKNVGDNSVDGMAMNNAADVAIGAVADIVSADIVGDTSYIAEIQVDPVKTVAYYDGKDLAARKRQMSAPSSSNTEEYKNVSEKPFLTVAANPLSTFGADVDTAGYGMVRRMILQENRLPVANAVRIEEMINYFHYDYPMPEKDEMMQPHFEMQAAPWNPSHQLLLVGVQAKTIPVEELPSSHYVFLIDNSGSMSHVFPMVKDAMTALAKQLRKGDSVSMVTYGGGVNVLLEAAWDPEVVCAEIAKLQAGGFTPGGEGIQKAYQIAEQHFIKGGNNRIVLITDGDFNVGTSSEAELVQMVEEKQKSCIYLTVVGCGMGNYKDNKMKMLANKGNGNYFYLDNPREAKNVFIKGMTSNMVTICRDVKFQIEFNPGKVFAYRLLGYELRGMASTDFRNDAKDSGEVGMGQQVTALYELVSADSSEDVKKQVAPGWQPLKYARAEHVANDELLTFRIRYKLPQGDAPAVEKTTALTKPAAPSDNWNWASSVAETALKLRRSPYAGNADYARAAKRAQTALGDDADGQRAEFLLLIHRIQELDAKQ